MTAVHHHNWHDFDHNHLRNTVLRLAAAAAVIVILHTLAVYGLLIWRQVEAIAEPAAIMIEMAPMPTSAPSEEQETAPGPTVLQSLAEPTPDAPDLPEELAPPPEPVVEQVLEKLPEPPPTPAKAEVVLPEPQPEKKEKPPEKPKPRPVQKPKPEAKPTRRQQAPATTAAPRSDAPVAQSTAAPSAGSAASRAATLADWNSRVRARFAAQKRYPGGAPEGTPIIHFVIGSGGQLVSVSLSRSSGSAVLDNEALAMARRGSPYPPPPPGLNSGTFTVPIRFSRR